MGTIAENVRELRLKLGWSQEKLAEAAGVSQTTIDKIEQGKTLKSRYLGKIAQVLGSSLEEVDPEIKDRANFTVVKPFATEPLQKTSITPFEIDTYGGYRALNDKMPLLVPAWYNPNGWFGFDNNSVSSVSRPRLLDERPRAYGVFILGEDMAPELETGDVALFDPLFPPSVDMTAIFYSKSEGIFDHTIARIISADTISWKVKRWINEEIIELRRPEYRGAHRLVGRITRAGSTP